MKIVENIAKANTITHAGVFHADEVFSTVILDNVFKEGVTLHRTFKPVDAPKEAIIYDIGLGAYDHHQKDAELRPDGHKYAAFGLIWRDFGAMYLCSLGISYSTAKELAEIIDKKFVSMIDALDNGETPDSYYPFNPAPFISMLNPNWDDSMANENVSFLKATEYADAFMKRIVQNEASKLRAKQQVDEAIEKAESHIMKLDRFVPWQEHLFNNEAGNDIWYIIYPSKRGGWNVQCVPEEPGSFVQRAPIHDDWKGDPKATGVEDCTFVHATGFIAAFDSIDGAYEYARKAVLLNEK